MVRKPYQDSLHGCSSGKKTCDCEAMQCRLFMNCLNMYRMNGRALSKQPNGGGETVLRSGALDPTKPK